MMDTSTLSNDKVISQLATELSDEYHRSSTGTQFFDLRKMLRELQRRARPKVDTNLDEAKRLAAIDIEIKKQKEQEEQKLKESEDSKKKQNLIDKVKTKMIK